MSVVSISESAGALRKRDKKRKDSQMSEASLQTACTMSDLRFKKEARQMFAKMAQCVDLNNSGALPSKYSAANPAPTLME